MIRGQLALLQREAWEHRSIYVTPFVVALLTVLVSLTGQVSVNGEHVDIGIVGMSNMPENARAAALSGILVTMSGLFLVAMWFLTIFYALDSLYAERKDRSILFWRSTPSTDFETVISKLLTAIIVIPLITFAMIVTTHLIVMLITSVWLGVRGANPWHLIWSSAPFLDTWTATFVFLLAVPLWLSPFIGWFLFVSAYAKRSPFLTAFLPIVMLPLFEKMLFGSTIIFEALTSRLREMPLFTGLDNLELLFQEDDFSKLGDANLSLLSLLDLGSFFANPSLWIGIVVCGFFITAAIYVRRYRDDS